ncbi:MAG: hypothetical protein PHG95_02910 [Patescibacteria group bacterium]|nr:hypothetical protein [Patescibacteria group bacterium]
MRNLSLRPVEQLFLLVLTGHENCLNADYLSAILSFFHERGLINVSNQRISISAYGENCLAKERVLSGYEILALNAIRSDDLVAFADSFDENVIRREIISKGYLEKVPRFSNVSKAIPILGEICKRCAVSPAGEEKIKELLLNKEKLIRKVSLGQSLDIVQLSIFPSVKVEKKTDGIRSILIDYAWKSIQAFSSFFHPEYSEYPAPGQF